MAQRDTLRHVFLFITVSFLPLCDDGKFNKFNGTGVGYILKR